MHWVYLEFLYTFFAMSGLAIAIFGYEWALYHDGFAGITSLVGGNMTTSEIEAALKARSDVPYAYEIKLIGAISTFISIAFLTLYKIGHVNWVNNLFNQTLLRETLNSSQHDFHSLDHRKSKHCALVKVERKRSIATTADKIDLDASFTQDVA